MPLKTVAKIDSRSAIVDVLRDEFLLAGAKVMCREGFRGIS
jgi:aerobic-type carbon monoxide dehydrogenase small subunit (CoxS/CutS family)